MDSFKEVGSCGLKGTQGSHFSLPRRPLKGNTVSGGGWLSLKECWQGQWLQKPLVQAFQKKPSTLPGMYLDNHRTSPAEEKGLGSPRLAPDDVMPPPRMPVKAVCFGQLMGALVSAPSLPGCQAGMTAPVDTPPPPPCLTMSPVSLPWASHSL